MIDDDMRRIMERAADAAAPPRLDVPWVLAAVRRRRRRRTAGAAVALIAVAGAATGVALPLLRTSSGPADVVPALTGQVGEGGIRCGQPFPGPALGRGPVAGIAPRAVELTASPDGAVPAAKVAISADRDVSFVFGAGEPSVLVLRRDTGVVVDQIGGRQRISDQAPKAPALAAIGIGGHAAPGRPDIRIVTPQKWSGCPGTDWARIWAHPSQYRLLTLMTTPAVQGPDGPDTTEPSQRDQLIGTESDLIKHKP